MGTFNVLTANCQLCCPDWHVGALLTEPLQMFTWAASHACLWTQLNKAFLLHQWPLFQKLMTDMMDFSWQGVAWLLWGQQRKACFQGELAIRHFGHWISEALRAGHSTPQEYGRNSTKMSVLLVFFQHISPFTALLFLDSRSYGTIYWQCVVAVLLEK